MTQPPPAQTLLAESARDALLALRAELAKAVVGQEGAVSGLVIALLCRGHVLLEGVPGVAKTLLVRALSAALHEEAKEIAMSRVGVHNCSVSLGDSAPVRVRVSKHPSATRAADLWNGFSQPYLSRGAWRTRRRPRF